MDTVLHRVDRDSHHHRNNGHGQTLAMGAPGNDPRRIVRIRFALDTGRLQRTA